MAFSIRLTEEERTLAESYAKPHSVSIGEAFKRKKKKKVEEEFDIAVADKAYDDCLKSVNKKFGNYSKGVNFCRNFQLAKIIINAKNQSYQFQTE